jgi:hypothetical protein
MSDDQDEIEGVEDFESLDDRIRRGPLLGVLFWTALIAGAVWVVLNAMIQIRLIRATRTSSPRRREPNCGTGRKL